MPQWLHNPPLAAFFLFHMVVWCRHPIAPLVKPLNKWKSTSMLKLLMVIILPPPPPNRHHCHFYLLPLLSPFSYASVFFSHPPLTSLPSDCSLFSAEGVEDLHCFTVHFISSSLTSPCQEARDSVCDC